MAFELEGTLVEKFDTQKVSDKFQKREFVIEQKENRNGYDFQEFIKFQLVQDRCNMIEEFEPGQNLKISFNLRGRKWEKDGNTNYFTNLEAWRIVASDNAVSQDQETPVDSFSEDDPDNALPF